MSSTSLDDVIPEILRRLPTKDLLRFRSVSKPWRSLIDSPNFMKLHLKTHNLGAIVTNRELFWINLDSPASAASKLPSPIEGTGGKKEIIGSCNGLVVFNISRVGLTLWNPATRKHRRIHLPSAEPERRPVLDELVGFGHDPVDDEYKLLREETFPCLQTGNFNSVFTVHSLKAKTWKRVEELSFQIFISKGCAFVHNAFHLIVVPSSGPGNLPPEASSPWSIFALDANAQTFREVPKPEHGHDGRYPDMMVQELRGSLCFIRRYAKRKRFVVWTMNEYGVKESWAKLLSVGPTEMGRPFRYVVPLAFERNGANRVLLETGKGLALFDLRSKSVENLKISGVGEYIHMCPCVESLVRLDWDGCELEEEKPKPSGKKSGLSKDTFLAIGFKLKL